MLIDCATCVARHIACDSCVIRVLLDAPAQGGAMPAPVELDADERAALELLAAAGLVPPLRLVRAQSGPDVEAGPVVPRGDGGLSPGSARSAARGIA